MSTLCPVRDDAAYQSFLKLIPELLEEAQYSEIYGFDFSGDTAWCIAHKRIIISYLNETNQDVAAACKRFVATLKWRKEFRPLNASSLETHTDRYEGFTTMKKVGNQVYSWYEFDFFENPETPDRRNQLLKGSRGPEFVRWMVGQFERKVALIGLESEETEALPLIEILDFSDVPAFGALGFGKETRAVCKEFLIIQAQYYPGIIGTRCFVDLPVLMSWLLVFFQLRLGGNASREFTQCKKLGLAANLGDWVPKEYGGTNPSHPDPKDNQRGSELCLQRIREYNIRHGQCHMILNTPESPGICSEKTDTLQQQEPPYKARRSITSFPEWIGGIVQEPIVYNASDCTTSDSEPLGTASRKRRHSNEPLHPFYSPETHFQTERNNSAP